MALTGGIFSTWRLELCSKIKNKVHSFLGHRSGWYRGTMVFDHTNLFVSRNNHQTLGVGRGGREALRGLKLPSSFFFNSIGEETCLSEWKGDGLWYHHSWHNPRIANATTILRASSALGGRLWCVHFVKMKASKGPAQSHRAAVEVQVPMLGCFNPRAYSMSPCLVKESSFRPPPFPCHCLGQAHSMSASDYREW